MTAIHPRMEMIAAGSGDQTLCAMTRKSPREKLGYRYDSANKAFFDESAENRNEVAPQNHDRRAHDDKPDAEDFRKKDSKLHGASPA
jgi:hypothetical protein